MEKKIEDSKPILNRTRRQLLVGAALTPVVMTLHSAKVYADVTLAEGHSGPAPFSGAIAGSANINGTTGNQETELKLYSIIVAEDEAANKYYGYKGNPNITSTALTQSQILGWSGNEWSFSSDSTTKMQWTQGFEARFVTPINDYMSAYKSYLAELAGEYKTDEGDAAYEIIKDLRPANPTGYSETIDNPDYRVGAVAFYYNICNVIDSIITLYPNKQEAPSTGDDDDDP